MDQYAGPSEHAPDRPVPSPGRNVLLGRAWLAATLAELADWVTILATIVYAYDRGGSATAGLTSIAMLAPAALAAPVAGLAADGQRPNRLFVATFAAGAASLAVATVLAAVGAPLALMTAAVSIALGSIAVMRPALSVVLPSLARSPAELTRANVRFVASENATGFIGPVAAAFLLAVSGPLAALAAGAVFHVGGLLAALPVRREDRLTHPRRAGRRLADRPRFTPATPARLLRAQWAMAGAKPALRPLLVVAGGQAMIIGSLDLFVVVLAREELSMGSSGSAVLSALFGAGAVAA